MCFRFTPGFVFIESCELICMLFIPGVAILTWPAWRWLAERTTWASRGQSLGPSFSAYLWSLPISIVPCSWAPRIQCPHQARPHGLLTPSVESQQTDLKLWKEPPYLCLLDLSSLSGCRDFSAYTLLEIVVDTSKAKPLDFVYQEQLNTK